MQQDGKLKSESYRSTAGKVYALPACKFLIQEGNIMKMKTLMKKAAAVAAAGVLGTSLLPSAVFAADSFTGLIQENLAAKLPAFAQAYSEGLANSGETKGSAQVGIDVTLGDVGKQLLASTGIDFSWLNSATLNMGVAVDDLNATIIGEALVNGTHIASLNAIADMQNMIEYIQIPELSDAYAYISLNSALAQAGIDPAQYQQILDMAKNIGQYYPTGEQLTSLISKYVPVILSGVTDQGTSTASVTASGVTAECTVYEATLDEKGAIAIVQALNDTVATDTELEAVLDNFGTLFAQLGQPMDLYEQLKATLAQTAQEASSSTADSTEYFDFKVFQDAEGNMAAFTMECYDAPGAISTDAPTINIKFPKSGDQIGFEASIAMEGEAYSITGAGTLADGKLSGSYNVNVGPQAVATITLTDVTTDAAADPVTGSASVQIVQSEMTQSDSTLQMLASFTPVCSWNFSKASKSGSLTLDIQTGGASLGTATISFAPAEITALGAPSAATSYNIEDDTQANSWISGFKIDALLANLQAAGVPESLINQVMGTGDPAAAGAAAPADGTAEAVEVEPAA